MTWARLCKLAAQHARRGGLVQRAVRSPWPAITGCVLTLALMLAGVGLSDGEAVGELVLLLAPAVVTLFLIDRLVVRRRAFAALGNPNVALARS